MKLNSIQKILIVALVLYTLVQIGIIIFFFKNIFLLICALACLWLAINLWLHIINYLKQNNIN